MVRLTFTIVPLALFALASAAEPTTTISDVKTTGDACPDECKAETVVDTATLEACVTAATEAAVECTIEGKYAVTGDVELTAGDCAQTVASDDKKTNTEYISLKPAEVTLPEGATPDAATAPYTVTLSEAAGKGCTVNFATKKGADEATCYVDAASVSAVEVGDKTTLEFPALPEGEASYYLSYVKETCEPMDLTSGTTATANLSGTFTKAITGSKEETPGAAGTDDAETTPSPDGGAAGGDAETTIAEEKPTEAASETTEGAATTDAATTENATVTVNEIIEGGDGVAALMTLSAAGVVVAALI
eukprot:Blabericola_migrator_1__4863@NODE_2546_length_2624_cov_9_243645_g1592_i0_p1_GENE_NODE_2546_length_2624_cov_9_243645_g1592_i0NODE_2546_length_2624_cov_9_243645_g1592_i0_p1_ORF_typecomplete_len305_score91_73CBM_35/PF16990_5/8_6CBM_35/PF16990_5/23CBM_35/PF16990_5/7_7e02_NODE_2546_length_2624_cov_9_243645_g1592_i02081122